MMILNKVLPKHMHVPDESGYYVSWSVVLFFRNNTVMIDD